MQIWLTAVSNIAVTYVGDQIGLQIAASTQSLAATPTHASFPPGESRVQPTTCWIKVRIHSWRASLGAERSQSVRYDFSMDIFPLWTPLHRQVWGVLELSCTGLSNTYLHNKRPHITSNKYCSQPQLHIGPFLIFNVTKVSMCTGYRMTRL